MYLVDVTVGQSDIEGKGVFANQDIPQGTIAWKYVEGHDIILPEAEYSHLTLKERAYLDKVAYLSSESNAYIYPPENDPALYTNHDATNHNLSVKVDKSLSPEPFFIANRDIKKGEELTNNYHEFDEAIKTKKDIPEWLN